MPAATRQRVLAFTSPDLRDLFFWERDTLSRADYTDLTNDGVRAYGTPHPDSDKFPNHVLCYWEQDQDFEFGRDGQDSLRVRKYYVADRADQDEYNFEFSAADIGGQKFDAVTRTYIIPRTEFDEAAPAMGTSMPTAPSGKFSADTYVLSGRVQKRIGQKELDSLYVVEVRTYVKKVTISRQQLDEATGGVVGSSTTLYYRGEDYGGTPIETAAADASAWGLTAGGVNVEVNQISENWWAVTNTEVIPQGLPDGPYGKTVRVYTTWQNFTWPEVLGPGSLEFRAIARKSGSDNVSVEIRPEKDRYSGATRFQVEQYWSKDAVSLPSPVIFDTKSGRYSGAQYSFSFSNVLLNGNMTLTDNIGTSDPVFEPGTYGGDPWETATALPTWPTGPAVIGSSQKPFRGGYLVTIQKAYPPY
jgi:hypothetical protein